MIRNEPFIFAVHLESRARPGYAAESPTVIAGDVQVSKDGGAFVAIETLPVPDGAVLGVTLSANEMDARRVTVRLEEQSAGTWNPITVDLFPVAIVPKVGEMHESIGNIYDIVSHVSHGNAAILARGNAAWVTATGFSTLTTMDVDNRLATWGKTGFALDAAAGWGGAALPTQFEASNMRGTDDAALEATLTAMKGEGWTTETLKAISEAVEAIDAEGTGARTITITVTDGTNPLEGARVRMTKGAENYVATTNASGVASVGRDDGTWAVTVTLAGYTFAPTTLVVTADAAVTYAMTAVTITPSDPGFISGYLTCYDSAGSPLAGVSIHVSAESGASTGNSYAANERIVTSDANGLATITNMAPGATYRIRRGVTGGWVYATIEADATSPLALDDLVGLDP